MEFIPEKKLGFGLMRLPQNDPSNVADVINRQIAIPCTACHYCTEGCPQHLTIIDFLKDVAGHYEH